MRGIFSSRTKKSYYDSEVREEGEEKERAQIVFCFVRRVGGHHDDRIEHKRGAPEGVTGHKILRLPFYAGVEMSGLSTFTYKTYPTASRPFSSTVTVDPPFWLNLSYDRRARLNR